MAPWGRDRHRNLDARCDVLLSAVTVRPAVTRDLGALERLAQLDSQPLPTGPHLVAERDGRIDAALSLSTGELVADPFRRTAALCELLRCRSEGPRPPVPTSPLRRLQPRPMPTTP